MRRIFSLLFVCLASAYASAADYTVAYTVPGSGAWVYIGTGPEDVKLIGSQIEVLQSDSAPANSARGEPLQPASLRSFTLAKPVFARVSLVPSNTAANLKKYDSLVWVTNRSTTCVCVTPDQMASAISSAVSGLVTNAQLSAAIPTNFATPSDLASLQTNIQASMTSMQAAMPKPANTVAPSDTTMGSAGAASTYLRGDSTRQRITRTLTVTLDAAGTATADWSAIGALPGPAVVLLEPIAGPNQVPKCWLSSVPTANTATLKCVLEKTDTNAASLTLNTSLLAASININGGNASGMKVQVVAFPPS